MLCGKSPLAALFGTQTLRKSRNVAAPGTFPKPRLANEKSDADKLVKDAGRANESSVMLSDNRDSPLSRLTAKLNQRSGRHLYQTQSFSFTDAANGVKVW